MKSSIPILPAAVASILLCAPALAQDDAGQIAFNNACRRTTIIRNR